MEAKLLFVHALSSLHAGTGRGVGVIDLPIAREKATQIPFLPGSTLKGVFRDACTDEIKRGNIFGPETGSAELHAGAVTFTDARLLLLPVRSLSGIFAWVTSPLLLRRLLRDSQPVLGLSLPTQIPVVPGQSCLISDKGCELVISIPGSSDSVVLEDLPLAYKASSEATDWAKWIAQVIIPEDIDFLQKRICIVSDDVLSFLLETATEVTARIRLLDDTKTVAQGQLWYEESLPAETVLTGLIVATVIPERATYADVFETVKALTTKTLQFGGNASVGRGFCKTIIV